METSSPLSRFSALQRFGVIGGLLLALLAVAGLFGAATITLREEPYFVPGRPVPTKEECFYDRLARFKNINRQIIVQVAQECELEIQSLQGHEKMYDAWVEEQAERARQRAEQKAEPLPEAPKEVDRVRRVWR